MLIIPDDAEPLVRRILEIAIDDRRDDVMDLEAKVDYDRTHGPGYLPRLEQIKRKNAQIAQLEALLRPTPKETRDDATPDH